MPDMPAAGAAPTDAEYRAMMKLIIPRFNVTNGLAGADAIVNLADADIPCAAAAGPTDAELLTGCNNLLTRVNNGTTKNIAPFVAADITGILQLYIRDIINKLVIRLNRDLVDGIQYNKGYQSRLEIACNQFDTCTTCSKCRSIFI